MNPIRHLLTVPLTLCCAAVLAAAQTFDVDIPAQALPSALEALAQQTGIKPFYPDGIVAGKTARAVSGRMTAEQALTRLLSGSGLHYRFNGKQAVAITPAAPSGQSTPSSDPSTLPAVTVSSYFDPDEAPASYSARSASTATKTAEPIFNTPFSIQVVPQQVIQDKQAVRLADAVENVSGVRKSNSSGGVYDNFIIRGFQVTDIFRDGFRTNWIDVDLANVERVEVLKGAAASLYGQIEPGGAINYVIKKPLPEAQYSLQQQFGSFDFYRTVADATGPLNDDKSLRYRAILTYQDSDSFRDELQDDRIMFSPSFAWDITDKTQAYLNFEYKNHEYLYDNGIPIIGNRPADLPINRFFGIRDGKLTNSENFLVNFKLSHAFNPDWKLTLNTNFRSQNRNFQDSYLNNLRDDLRTLNIGAYHAQVEEDHHMAELNLNGRFDTGPIKHNVLLAGEYYFMQWNWIENFLDSVADPIVTPRPLDIYNPQYQSYSETPNIPLRWAYGGRNEWFAFTFQDSAQLTDAWRLLFSGRYQEIRTSSSDYCDTFAGPCSFADPGFHPQTNTAFTPRVGTSYELLPWLSIFASYSESITPPVGGRLAGGGATQPSWGHQKEIGLKGSWLEDRITSSLSFYDLTKTNIATPVRNNGSFIEQTGEARSKGVEFDVSGQLTERWSVIGSYAYTDAIVTKDHDAAGNPRNLGHRLRNVPRNSGSFWTRYDLDYGIGLGTGVYLADQREGNNGNTWQMPGYVRWDTGLFYKYHLGKSTLSAQFNVYNLLDKRYYADFAGPSFAIPGASRTFMGTVRIDF